MRSRLAWGLVVVLFIACAAEGTLLVSRWHAASPPGRAALRSPDPWKDLDTWQRRMQGDIEREGRVAREDFDQLFSDDFLRRHADPFAAIDREAKQLESRLDERERKAFGSSFHDWFSRRIALGDVRTRVKDEGKNVAVTFDIPNLDTDSVKVDVDAQRIRLDYGARKVETKKHGSLEASEQVEKIVPLPRNADPEGFRVEHGANELTLVFEKRNERAS